MLRNCSIPGRCEAPNRAPLVPGARGGGRPTCVGGARRTGVFAVRKGRGRDARRLRRSRGPQPFRRSSARLPRSPAARRGGPPRVPSQARPVSVAAARRALRFFASFSREDAILCLVSGGASSSSASRRRAGALESKADGGPPAGPPGRLRPSRSNRPVAFACPGQGGRLARATAARIVTLVVSDVPRDRPALVGSVPRSGTAATT